MPRVDRLFLTSDFDTLKSDDVKRTSITIPASTGIASGATATFTATINVGEAQSLLSVMYSNTIDHFDGSYEVLTVSTAFSRTGGGGATYDVINRYQHLSGDTVRLIMSIKNPYGVPLTTSATAETTQFIVRSFKVPKFA